ncbi:cysteine proteinase [Pholiota conissans]|uniref:Cysteine proteinase n=1 Tax=Pholiota conissans TaxID=109636 RepID=A0A9P5Z3A2_9AGAR|nr:cysteine proteinase [Pholiota conissans]
MTSLLVSEYSEYQSLFTVLGLSVLVIVYALTPLRKRLPTVPLLSIQNLSTTRMASNTDDLSGIDEASKKLAVRKDSDPANPPSTLESSTESATLVAGAADNVVLTVEKLTLPTPTRIDSLMPSSPQAPKAQVGLLVNDELELALKECKEKVERIAKQYRAANKKFRDIEFDLENNSNECQYGLYSDGSAKAPEVRRITEIFDDPNFFKEGPSSNDIIQGALGDCWFLSALSTLTVAPDLLEKLCIARDEDVGIYGFVFFRDSHWVNVIVDDQLFCNTPKFEELKKQEQELYHDDKDLYNKLTRKSGKGLLYAKSGSAGETWVPLFEKAYAKLHGDYASLAGGRSSEGIEDLTGGVSVALKIADILDPDRFWTEELMQANKKTHLFGVSFPGLDEARSGRPTQTVQGLFGAHAYSILRTKECRGKRFIVLRNPWGSSEWQGPWSDGSKEWNGEWIEVLKELDHVLGDDGEFVMEYADFLNTWEVVQRTRIFDPTWVMSSNWLYVPPPPPMHPWTHGDVCFKFTLPKASPTIIVLSQLDSRYFKFIDGVASVSNIDFVVYKRGEKEVKGESYSGVFCQRGVCCELDLDEGEYIVYPRIDLIFVSEKGYFNDGAKLWEKRKLSRVLTQRTKGRVIASNYEFGAKKRFIPVSVEALIKQELAQSNSLNPKSEESEEDVEAESTTITTTTTTTVTTATVVEERRAKPSGQKEKIHAPAPAQVVASAEASQRNPDSGTTLANGHPDPQISSVTYVGYDFAATVEEVPKIEEAKKLNELTGEDEDETPIVLGLKVYTKRDAVVVVHGEVSRVSQVI